MFFTRRSSGPARRMDGLIAHHARIARDRIRVIRVDVDKYPDLAAELGVEAVPAIVLLRGRTPIGRLVGRASSAEIRELIDAHVPRVG